VWFTVVLISLDTRTDADLLRAGDADSFAAFYRRHARSVAGYLARRSGDPELAADLTAETFATALRARGRFADRGGDASAWLFRIAHNKLVDSVRRGRAEDRAQRLLGMQRVVPDAVDLDAIARLGDDGAVVSLVEELPADQRRAVVAKIVEDRSYPEIARELEVSEAVVRKRVSRGVSALRARIVRREP
jgi:RNA polymerase sigma-70 factor, ECF subfamily